MKPTIYIHHDAYPTIGPHLALVNAQHREENYPISNYGYYTFYQYFIESDGSFVRTRPPMDPLVVYKPEHKNSISICLAGNFDNTLPTPEQMEMLNILFSQLQQEYGINALNIHEHRDYQATSCPGALIQRGYFARGFISYQLKGVAKLVEQLKLSVALVLR